MWALRQVAESQPFVLELLSGLGNTILDLQPHQIHTFYEAVRRKGREGGRKVWGGEDVLISH